MLAQWVQQKEVADRRHAMADYLDAAVLAGRTRVRWLGILVECLVFENLRAK